MLSRIHDANWHLSRFVTYVRMMPIGVYHVWSVKVHVHTIDTRFSFFPPLNCSPFTGGMSSLGVHVDTTNPSNVFVKCTFQPGYSCTIDYGTDPSYTNLVYRDTSSTQGRMATITLSQRLRGDTTYYYMVSAVSSSQCVRERGRFQTGISEWVDLYNVRTWWLIWREKLKDKGWAGVGAKHEAQGVTEHRMQGGNAPDTSSRLASFCGQGHGSRVLPWSGWSTFCGI